MILDPLMREFWPVIANQPKTVLLRCPYCRQNGTMDVAGENQVLQTNTRGNPADRDRFRRIAFYLCRNKDCLALRVIATDINEKPINSWPTEPIDWNETDLPDKVHSALEEAVTAGNETLRESETAVRNIRNSWSWKLTSPLRRIASVFPRKKQRKK